MPQMSLNEMINESEEPRMSEVTSLTTEQYDSFYSSLCLLKEHVVDCDISNGTVRQMTDQRHAIFEIFLQDVIGNLNLPFITIKQKLDLLKMFVGSEVEISSDATTFQVIDSYSKFIFTKPAANYINIPFMDEQNFNERFNFSRATLLVDIPVSEKITDRMKIIAATLNSLVFFVEFNGETGKMYARAESRDQSIDIIREMPLNEPIDDAVCNITTTQLIVEHDGELRLQLYHDPEANIILNKTSGVIKSVPFNIYSRTTFLEEDGDF